LSKGGTLSLSKHYMQDIASFFLVTCRICTHCKKKPSEMVE